MTENGSDSLSALIPQRGTYIEELPCPPKGPTSISPNLWVLNLSIRLTHYRIYWSLPHAGTRMFVELASIANENSPNQP